MSTKQNNLLEVHLGITKESYVAGKPIEVTITLKNNSNTPVTINKRMGISPRKMPEGYWELRFDITYPPGKPDIPAPLVNRGKPQAKDFTELPPGGEITRTYALNEWYRMRFPGDYEVRAIYNNVVDGSMFGLSAWTGEITSNFVSLRVTE